MYTLPQADQKVLEKLGYKQKLDDVDKAILINADFLSKIAENPEIFGHDVDLDEENLQSGNVERVNSHEHHAGPLLASLEEGMPN